MTPDEQAEAKAEFNRLLNKWRQQYPDGEIKADQYLSAIPKIVKDGEAWDRWVLTQEGHRN